MEQGEVVYLKIFDKYKGDVVFEGKVSTDVEPDELVCLRCFWDRVLSEIRYNEANERVKSFKGLQNNVELAAAASGELEDFSGVLYVGAEDGVLRKSTSVPSCECVKMTVLDFSHEECEKAFKCATLEELEITWCKLRQIPKEIGVMKKLKKLRLHGLDELKSIPEEMGELSSLEELRIDWCRIESLPKRLKELKMLKSISLLDLSGLHLNSEDLVVFSKLRHLAIWNCGKVFTASFEQSFWEMVKSTTDLGFLELDWESQDGEMVAAALEENGSIVDGGEFPGIYANFFKRNKENHERAMECVLRVLAIRRWRNALSTVPKEMVKMIAMMLLITKFDIVAWTKRPIE